MWGIVNLVKFEETEWREAASKPASQSASREDARRWVPQSVFLTPALTFFPPSFFFLSFFNYSPLSEARMTCLPPKQCESGKDFVIFDNLDSKEVLAADVHVAQTVGELLISPSCDSHEMSTKWSGDIAYWFSFFSLFFFFYKEREREKEITQCCVFFLFIYLL